MANDNSDHDHREETEPQYDDHAQWLAGPLERPIVGDDDGWPDVRSGDRDDDRQSEAEDDEQDDRRYIIRLGGNGF